MAAGFNAVAMVAPLQRFSPEAATPLSPERNGVIQIPNLVLPLSPDLDHQSPQADTLYETQQEKHGQQARASVTHQR